MQENKPFHIDENILRDKLLSYHVTFNPTSLDFLEHEIDHIKTHTPIKLPETKKIIQFVAVPIIIVAFGVVAYFGFNYIKDVSEKATVKKDTIPAANPVVEPKQEIKKEEVTPPAVVTTSIIPEIKKDTLITATNTVSTTQKQIKDNNKKPLIEPIISSKKQDTTQTSNVINTKPDTLKKVDTDTSSISKNKDTATKRKKKKKKNSDVTEDIRQSTQQPNSADDDVVVPNN